MKRNVLTVSSIYQNITQRWDQNNNTVSHIQISSHNGSSQDINVPNSHEEHSTNQTTLGYSKLYQRLSTLEKLNLHWQGAISYTHLDVYKRQKLL